MADPTRSTIAQLLFAGHTAIGFSRIVAELQNVLDRQIMGGVRTAWDHDDLVTLETIECRILLSWNEVSGTDFKECLCVSVGPSEMPGGCTADEQLELLCSRIVERIQNRFNPVAVIWRQVQGSVNGELIDTLIERLSGLSPVLTPIDSLLDSIMTEDRSRAGSHEEISTPHRRPDPGNAEPDHSQAGISAAMAAESLPPRASRSTQRAEEATARRDKPDSTLELEAKISRVRIALYPLKATIDKSMVTDSYQMRMAAHAFNATLIFIWLPFGVAVFTYFILQGGDIRLSSRLLVICSTLHVISQPSIVSLFT